MGYGIFVSVMLVVGVLGYWAWGAAVPYTLLSASSSPAWLVTVANVMAFSHIIIVDHVSPGGDQTG